VVTPSSLSLKKDETGTFTVRFTRAAAALNAYTGGYLTWSDGSAHTVRIPIVIRPVALAAPAEVSGSYNVTFGYDGTFAAAARGLVAATTFTGSVVDDPTDSFAPGGPGTTSFPVVVPAGTSVARFSLFDANVTPPSDLDLYVFRGDTLVGSSGGSTSAESVTLLNPPAATYTVYVHGFAVPAGATASFTLFTWSLGTTAAGNMTVAAPSTAVNGASAAINLTFTGLAPATKYLGSVAYTGSVTGLPNPTLVRVDSP
jgi:Fibronectin type-III domain